MARFPYYKLDNDISISENVTLFIYYINHFQSENNCDCVTYLRRVKFQFEHILHLTTMYFLNVIAVNTWYTIMLNIKIYLLVTAIAIAYYMKARTFDGTDRIVTPSLLWPSHAGESGNNI